MDYSEFMTNCLDENLRGEYWKLFNLSEPDAKWFGSLHNNWVEITSVKHHPTEAVWDYGKIRIPASENNLGAIFHEIFHSSSRFCSKTSVQSEVSCVNSEIES